MRIILTSLLCFFITSTCLLAQEIQVVDEAGNGVPYVNLYVPVLSTGTVTDFSGNLELPQKLKKAPQNTAVQLSCIGFEDVQLTLQALKAVAGGQLVLTKAAYELPEAEVVGSNKTFAPTQRLGLYKPSTNVYSSFTSDSSDARGVEIGNVIRIKKNRSWKLSRIGANLKVEDTTGVFEVNVYAYEKGEPGRILNKQRLFIEVAPGGSGEGSEVDFSDNPIYGEGNFIVVIEALSSYFAYAPTFNSRLAFTPKKKITRYRQQDGKWRKTPLGVVVGVYCDVELEE